MPIVTLLTVSQHRDDWKEHSPAAIWQRGAGVTQIMPLIPAAGLIRHVHLAVGIALIEEMVGLAGLGQALGIVQIPCRGGDAGQGLADLANKPNRGQQVFPLAELAALTRIAELSV